MIIYETNNLNIKIIGCKFLEDFNYISNFIKKILGIYSEKINNKKDPLKVCGVNRNITKEINKYYSSIDNSYNLGEVLPWIYQRLSNIEGCGNNFFKMYSFIRGLRY